MFPWKKYLISLKAPELFRKTYFQIKVIKSGRCHYLGPGWVPWGIFAATAHIEARFSCYFHILFTSHTLQNSHVEALCLWKNLCAWKKSTAEESPWEQKSRKRQAQRKERVALFQVKNTILLWKRLVLTELHAGAQISNKEVVIQPKFTIHNV